MITSARDYFKQVTNSSNLFLTARDPRLANLQEAIEDSIVTKGTLVTDLISLSAHNKARLITALVQNNSHEIVRLLYQSMVKINPTVEEDVLMKITELSTASEQTQWLSTPVLRIIKTMISNNHDTHKALIIQKAMQKIPDSHFTNQVKMEIVKSIDRTAVGMINSYAYASPSTAMNDNKYSGDINKYEYYWLCTNESLDISEFIVSTVGALQYRIENNIGSVGYNTPIREILAEVRNDYNRLEYKDAVNKIIHLYSQDAFFKDTETKEDLDIRKYILDRATSYSHPMMSENFTRRFYENRLVQLGVREINLEQVNKVSLAISSVKASSLDDLLTLANAALLNKQGVYFERYNQLLANSERFRHRDRTLKKNLPTKDEEFKGMRGSIWSQNPGVMTSNQPNFFDETTPFSMKGKVGDKYLGRIQKAPHDKSNKSAYVASISGHLFYVVAQLEDYMQTHQGDDDLESDINHYLKAFISSYVSHGYHSYSEMQGVFDEPHVKAIFDAQGVTLDLGWTEEVIRKAMNDTQQYTKMICFKRALSDKIKSLQKSISNDEFKIHEKACKHLRSQLSIIKSKLNFSQDKPNLFNVLTEEEKNIVLEVLTELKAIKDELTSNEFLNPEKEIPIFSQRINEIIKNLHKKILNSDNPESKLEKIVSELFEKLEIEKKSIENLYGEQKGNALLKKIHSQRQ